jgi:hypothetical protein
MTLIGAMFLLLFIPGLLTVALIVAIALPRALRDEEDQKRLAAEERAKTVSDDRLLT